MMMMMMIIIIIIIIIKRTLMVHDPQITLQFTIIKEFVLVQYNLLPFTLFSQCTSPCEAFKSNT